MAKLVAKQYLHLADKYAERAGKRYREIAPGEEFDVQDEDVKELIERGRAEKPSAEADREDAKPADVKEAEAAAAAKAKEDAGKAKAQGNGGSK